MQRLKLRPHPVSRAVMASPVDDRQALGLGTSPQRHRDTLQATMGSVPCCPGAGVVARDDVVAVRHFREAASAGMAAAYDALGQMVLAGRGVARDRGDAMECFRRAADLGFGEAADRLARMHEQPGPGELPDPEAARRWYRKAIAMGFEPARSHLQVLQQRFPT